MSSFRMIKQLISEIENPQFSVDKQAILQRLKMIAEDPPPTNKDQIKFRDLVKRETNHEVVKASADLMRKVWLYGKSLVGTRLTDGCRINENGNKMEEFMLTKDPTHFQRPRTNHNKIQVAGYPDLELHHTKPTFDKTLDIFNASKESYVEVKLCEEGKEDDKLRTFYLSTFHKITSSHPHLLLAFFHDKKNINSVRVIDLYDQTLTVKIEYNASNKDLYLT